MNWLKTLSNALLTGATVAVANNVVPAEYVGHVMVGVAVVSNLAGLVQTPPHIDKQEIAKEK